MPSRLSPRSSASTRAELTTQWRNPSDILSLLMIIGSDIVKSALAQMTGGLIAPVCFSFGWVAYGFTSVADVVGKGRLMPEPDFACKVINLSGNSGHPRENKNWMVGRIFRDLDTPLDQEALRIRIFDAVDGQDGHAEASKTSNDEHWYLSIGIMILQLGVAAIPCGLYQDWSILTVTTAGTFLALLTGALPQWKAEKYAARVDSSKDMALVVGNGSRHLVVIRGNGHALDFEDLASSQGPKARRSWESFAWFRRSVYKEEKGQRVLRREPAMFRELPVDFWFTRLICTVLAACWVALLITVSGIQENTWYLIAVGAIGMVQNAVVAAVAREPKTRGVHLRLAQELSGVKVMDVLMDLDCVIPESGRHLVNEYFPAGMREKNGERRWWDGEKEEYDNIRYGERETRGTPKSMKNG